MAAAVGKPGLAGVVGAVAKAAAGRGSLLQAVSSAAQAATNSFTSEVSKVAIAAAAVARSATAVQAVAKAAQTATSATSLAEAPKAAAKSCATAPASGNPGQGLGKVAGLGLVAAGSVFGGATGVLALMGMQQLAKLFSADKKVGSPTETCPLKAGPADNSAPTKTPTADQIKEIQAELDKGESQKAIDKTIDYYGLDTTNVNGKVSYDPNLKSANAETDSKRSITIGPSAVTGVAPGRLAATINHEITHANQIQKHGWPANNQEVAAYEAMGYQSALNNADAFRLTKDQRKWYSEKIADYRGKLTGENKATYDKGQYWDLK